MKNNNIYNNESSSKKDQSSELLSIYNAGITLLEAILFENLNFVNNLALKAEKDIVGTIQKKRQQAVSAIENQNLGADGPALNRPGF